MALYEGFKATNIWNAFILNSIVAALVILFAMLIKDHFDVYTDAKGNTINRTTTTKSVIFTLAGTFLSSFLAFTFMHFVFDYGRGQLITTSNA